MVNTLQAERAALAQELHWARQASTEDVQPVAKKQAVARQVHSCQEVRGLVQVMPNYVPNDVMSWLQDQADCQQALYGMRGVRVGEASHPGPVQTRNARRLMSTQLDPDDEMSSDSDGDHDVHVCRAPTSAIDYGRVAVLSGPVVPSAPKRLRLTSRNLRVSHASTLPAAEFDLTRVDSDRDIQVAGRKERPRSGAGNNILPFEP